MFTDPYPEGYPNVWALSVETGWGGSTVALAVFNLSGKTLTQRIQPSWFGIKDHSRFTVFEWWNCRWLGEQDSAFDMDVPPYDMIILHAAAKRKHPWIVSTDLHYTPGWIMDGVFWDEKKSELSGTLTTKSEMVGTIYGTCSESYQAVPGIEQKVRNDGSGQWQMKIATYASHTPFTVPFEKAFGSGL